MHYFCIASVFFWQLNSYERYSGHLYLPLYPHTGMSHHPPPTHTHTEREGFYESFTFKTVEKISSITMHHEDTC